MKKSLKTIFGALAAVLMLCCLGCSTEVTPSGGVSGPGSSSGNESTSSGDLTVTVDADGSISCKKCGKVYNFKVQAESCEHYKCADCGTSYYTQDELDACEHSVIHFVDSADESKNYTVTIKKGTNITLPEWTKEGFEICWTSEPADIDPSSAIDAEEVTFTATWTSTYSCQFCGKVYYTSEEADACAHYTCTNEACEKHTAGYATQAEADICNLKDGCPAYKVTCSQCGKEYSHDTDANACEHYKCPSCGTSYNSQAELDACETKEGCAAWRATCTNCGTEYKTQTEADNCSKQEGCPKFGALTTITFEGTKTVTAVCDSEAITVTAMGNVKSGGSITYNGVTYSVIMKMESATSVVISGAAGKTMTIVTDTPSKGIKINGTKNTTDTNGIVTVTVPDGDSVTITKGDTMNVGVIFIEQTKAT